MNLTRNERDSILTALGSGVVPVDALHHIQVGRAAELEALIRDLQAIAEGRAAARFIIGVYGSGKTFQQHLTRVAALRMGLLTMHADMTPSRRLYGKDGMARNLYTELVANTSTESHPKGGAFQDVLARLLDNAKQAAAEGGDEVSVELRRRMLPLEALAGGYDFIDVVVAYFTSLDTGDHTLARNAMRWLTGSFTTKTQAKTALGVGSIVSDDNAYDMIKLLAGFATVAGYRGLAIFLDEMEGLLDLTAPARAGNYRMILRIVNECLQGSATNLGVFFTGTPASLLDPDKGLHSNGALRSRLAENPYGADGLRDLAGPVIRLAKLTYEDHYVALLRIRDVHAEGLDEKLMADDDVEAYLRKITQRSGDPTTARELFRTFVHLLQLLEQNPEADWEALVSTETFVD